MSLTSKPQVGVQSLEIGLRIFDTLLAQPEPIMLKNLSHLVNMTPAKVHRYLVSFVRMGYVKQTADGRYVANVTVSNIATEQKSEKHVLNLLSNASREIIQHITCSVQICQWFDDRPIVIDAIESDYPINIITKIGSSLPLIQSATGRLFTSHCSETYIQPHLKVAYFENKALTELSSKPNEEGFEVVWQLFLQHKAKIIEQGYATVQGDMLMGINAISLPFFVNEKMPKNNDTQVNQRVMKYGLTCISTVENLPFHQSDIIERLQLIQRKYQYIIDIND